MFNSFVLEETVDPANVYAGGWAFFLTIVLIVAVALLLFSFSRHVRKAKQPWPGEESETQDQK